MRPTIARLIAIAAVAAAGSATAAIAVLVNTEVGVSETGRSIWICTYQAPSGTLVTRNIPVGAGPCPATINVY